MPIFSINAGIGRNLICSGDDTEGFYQILALKTSITPRLFLHVGYQLSKFKNPQQPDAGVWIPFLQEKVEEITSGSIHHRQHSVPYISLNSC